MNNLCSISNCKNRFEQLENLVKTEEIGDYKVLIISDIVDILSEKNEYNKALSWIKIAKEKYPKSQFLNNIISRENNILHPVLNIHFENHTLANKPMHLLADAKNVNQFSLNIYEVKNDEENFLKYISNLHDKNSFSNVKKSLVRKEVFNLNNPKDYKNHKTSFEIKPLPSGIYMVEYIVENEIQENFYFIASNSRIIFNKKNERKSSENQWQLVNRENGKIIDNQNLQLYELLESKN